MIFKFIADGTIYDINQTLENSGFLVKSRFPLFYNSRFFKSGGVPALREGNRYVVSSLTNKLVATYTGWQMEN